MWQRWDSASKTFQKSADNGETWTPLGLDASILTQGSIPDARLSSNVALRDVDNNFSAAYQSFQGHINLVGNFQNGGQIYPGRIDGQGPVQGSWYLATHGSYGLFSNTGLSLNGGLWVGPIFASALSLSGNLTVNGTTSANMIQQVKSAVIFPGDVSGTYDNQSSWYIAGHPSFGLYSNTNLYLAGSILCEQVQPRSSVPLVFAAAAEAGSYGGSTGSIWISANGVQRRILYY